MDTEHQIIRIIEGREYDHEVPSKIADDIFEHHTRISNLKWFIDGSNRGFINEVKVKFGESLTWDKTHPISIQSHTVIPVNFSTEHKQMLYKTFNLLSKGMIAIPKQYDKLITALRTAQATEWNLDKENTVNDDSLDALRLLLSSDKAIKIEGDRR